MLYPALDRGQHLARIAFEPVAVEGLGHNAELDDEIAGEVLWLNLSALFSPKSKQGGLIVAHYGSGVRTADERPTIPGLEGWKPICRHESSSQTTKRKTSLSMLLFSEP
jgi:hypothetical protein